MATPRQAGRARGRHSSNTCVHTSAFETHSVWCNSQSARSDVWPHLNELAAQGAALPLLSRELQLQISRRMLQCFRRLLLRCELHSYDCKSYGNIAEPQLFRMFGHNDVKGPPTQDSREAKAEFWMCACLWGTADQAAPCCAVHVRVCRCDTSVDNVRTICCCSFIAAANCMFSAVIGSISF